MAVKNIQINYNNGTGYDVLYPMTDMSSVDGLNSNLTTLDNSVSSLSSTVSDLQNTLANFNPSVWTEFGTFVSVNAKSITIGDVYYFIRRPVIIAINYLTGSATLSSTSYGATLSYRIGNYRGEFYRISDSSSNWTGIHDYSSECRPMIWLYPLYSRAMGYQAGSGDSVMLDTGQLGSVELSYKNVLSTTFAPSNFGESAIYEGSDFTIVYNNIKSGSTLNLSVTIYTMDSPIAIH